MAAPNPSDEFESELTSVRGLSSAILLRAVLDYRALKNGELKESEDLNLNELDEFFRSKWFNELCEACDLDSKLVLQKLNITKD